MAACENGCEESGCDDPACDDGASPAGNESAAGNDSDDQSGGEVQCAEGCCPTATIGADGELSIEVPPASNVTTLGGALFDRGPCGEPVRLWLCLPAGQVR